MINHSNSLKWIKRIFLFSLLLFVVHLSAPFASGQVVRTAYAPIISAVSGECLDIAGQQTGDGANAVQWPCQFAVNEEWNLQPYGTGFRVLELQSSKCLSVANSKLTAGILMVLQTCKGLPNEVWNISPAAKIGSFTLQSALSGLCMDSGSWGTGSWVSQQACSGPTATWIFKGGLILPTQLATLQANHSGQCMVFGAGIGFSGLVTQTPCSGAAAEQWNLVPTSNGRFQIKAASTGMCLDVLYGGTAPGSNMDQYPCGTPSDNQQFNLLAAGGGYLVQSVRSGLCIDVQNASQAPGAALVTATCNNVPDQIWSLATANVQAIWTAPLPLNVNPIGIANLPNGKLMTWSTNTMYYIGGDDQYFPSQTYTSIFDPVAMNSGAAVITTTGTDMFCPGTANLPDGRVLINGGSASPMTNIYDPALNAWSVDKVMQIWRGYEADTVLSTGSVFTLGGSWSGDSFNLSGLKSGEVWTSGKGWTLLTGVPDPPFTGPDPNGAYRGDNHMWLFAQSNGTVFHAGPSAAMHWINTSGTGSYTSAGNRGDDSYSINGSAVLYDVGKILKAGGAPAYDNGVATTSAYTININNPSAVNVTKVAPMAYPRAFTTGVALPTGQVLIVGGQTLAVAFTDTGAILVPEIWDPNTNVFQQIPAMQTPRTYHSTALLLPDGRVFVGGGGQCGPSCSANHFNTEILTPPYLLNANGSAAVRPVITSAPPQISLGTNISVTTDSPVVSFVLMRLSSNTHTVNNDQRRIPLLVQSTNATTYGLTIPLDPGVVLPGYYMLFALNANDVPSIAATVEIH